MKIIPKSTSFCAEGALVPTKEELDAIINALIDTRQNLMRTRGTNYGPFDIEGLSMMVVKLTEFKKQRGP